MSVKETYKNLRELLSNITSDLEKSENGNKAASQRVRTGTVRLEKLAKLFRKESISFEKKNKGSTSKKSVKSGSHSSAKKGSHSTAKGHSKSAATARWETNPYQKDSPGNRKPNCRITPRPWVPLTNSMNDIEAAGCFVRARTTAIWARGA